MEALTPELRRMTPWVTTGNEAYHFQINNSLRTVTQQHQNNAEIKLEALALSSLLAHNGAAYHPTTAQWRKKDIISVLCGSLARSFFPVPDCQQPEVASESANQLTTIAIKHKHLTRAAS